MLLSYRMVVVDVKYAQRCPSGLLLFQNDGSVKPLDKALEILQESWSIFAM